MLQFFARRLLLAIPVIIGILVVTFALTRSIPGDPCLMMLGERATKEKCVDFKRRYGLDQSLPIQFVSYVGQIVRGDLGTSIRTKRMVSDIVSERLPMTIEITIGAMLFSTTIGVTLGIISALRHNSAIDVGTMVAANIGVSMPIFWLGLLLAYFFAVVMRGTPFFIPPSGRLSPGLSLKPLAQVWGLTVADGGLAEFGLQLLSNSTVFNSLVTGNWKVLRDALWHLILPCLAVGTISLAIVARMTRAAMLEVLGQDYIRTARAKGVRERLVILRHALRNALVPIVTVIGLQVGGLLSGAVLTETVFSLPGVGTQMVEAIQARDYPVVQAFVVVIAVIFVMVNLLVDLSYAYLNPRIRLR